MALDFADMPCSRSLFMVLFLAFPLENISALLLWFGEDAIERIGGSRRDV